MRSRTFALRASAESWQRFWEQEGPALDGGHPAFHHPHQELGVAGLDQEGGGEIAPPPDQPRIVIDQLRQR
jgi:hypothetical protein